jgi:predicted AAA+ superfamily ATPase
MNDPRMLPLLLRLADAFVWRAEQGWLEPVDDVHRVDIGLLRGIDRVRDILVDNTRRFAAGLPANNALLWGARGTGKSSLVKAVHAAVNAERPRALALVEIHVRGYAARYRLDLPSAQLEAEANEWAITRGSRSGRVAWQFVQDLAGRLGKTLA